MTSDEKFPKKEHLIKTSDFRKVYKNGSSFRKEDLVFYALPNERQFNRLGLVVGTRHVKRATRRNRIKRVLRDIYRREKKSLKKGFDIVLVIKKDPPKEKTHAFLNSLFRDVAKKSNLCI